VDSRHDAPVVAFTTTLLKQGNNTGVLVPDTIVDELGGGKRPKVVVTVGDYTYRSSVASMGGRFLIAFSSAHRAATGLVGGETIDVTLEIDDAPREIEVPDDLAAALAAAGVRDAFDALSFSAKRGHVEPIAAAKGEDTRARRVQKVVDTLSA
jgi:hypothetical protein